MKLSKIKEAYGNLWWIFEFRGILVGFYQSPCLDIVGPFSVEEGVGGWKIRESLNSFMISEEDYHLAVMICEDTLGKLNAYDMESETVNLLEGEGTLEWICTIIKRESILRSLSDRTEVLCRKSIEDCIHSGNCLPLITYLKNDPCQDTSVIEALIESLWEYQNRPFVVMEFDHIGYGCGYILRDQYESGAVRIQFLQESFDPDSNFSVDLSQDHQLTLGSDRFIADMRIGKQLEMLGLAIAEGFVGEEIQCMKMISSRMEKVRYKHVEVYGEKTK